MKEIEDIRGFAKLGPKLLAELGSKPAKLENAPKRRHAPSYFKHTMWKIKRSCV